MTSRGPTTSSSTPVYRPTSRPGRGSAPATTSRNDLDRGHLVRRRDPVWGSTTVAAQANLDTFHLTNAAPQVAAFNQDKALWAGMEN